MTKYGIINIIKYCIVYIDIKNIKLQCSTYTALTFVYLCCTITVEIT